MRWVSYFPEIHNVHLTKDVGLMPLYMQRVGGFQAALLGRFPEKEYPALQSGASGLDTIKLGDEGHLSFLERATVEWIKKNAATTDVFQLSHLSRDTIMYGILYKRHNPDGQLYLKLDAYNDHLLSRKRHARSKLKSAILRRFEKRFFKSLDLITIENKPGFDIALATYPEWAGKLVYLPFGANDIFLKQRFPVDVTKEPLILSVGRLGSAEKNYELLLRALPWLDLRHWKIRLVGPVTIEFQSKWDVAMKAFPAFRRKILLTGQISDRQTLYAHYQRSRVFFLPSRVESFGIAFAEALYFGNVLVGHQGMFAYGDLSLGGKYGSYFQDDDAQSFANALHQAMEMTENQPDIHSEIAVHAAKNFHWSTLATRLRDELANRRNSSPDRRE